MGITQDVDSVNLKFHCFDWDELDAYQGPFRFQKAFWERAAGRLRLQAWLMTIRKNAQHAWWLQLWLWQWMQHVGLQQLRRELQHL